MDNVSMEKTTVLGGLVYFPNVRRKYISVVEPMERIVDTQRSAYHSAEGLLSVLIRVDIDISPEYVLRMLEQQQRRISPSAVEIHAAYTELLTQLRSAGLFTEAICMRLLDETVQAKAIRELQTQLTGGGGINSAEEALANFNTVISSIRKNPDDTIRIWKPFDDMEDLLVEKPRTPTGVAIVDKVLAGGIALGEHTGILGPSGGGKCLGRGTPILMYSGEIKPVEDVAVGDIIMGPDSTPREVLRLGRGRDTMYKVTPVKGDAYVVNSAHILTLVALAGVIINGRTYAKGDWIDINIVDYMNLSRYKRAVLKGIRVGVDFPERPEPELDPYFIGLYLGDGTTKAATTACEIANADSEIINYCTEYAASRGWNTRLVTQDGRCPKLVFGGKDSRTQLWARSLIGSMCTNDQNHKHIAPAYKYGSRSTRLAVLAGLLDTDGYMHHGHYEISSKFDELAADILFVARSLGYAAYDNYGVKMCTNTGAAGMYHRITISGDFQDLPVRLERRKAPPRQQCKDVLHMGITVTQLGEDDYFGFEISGDRRFVLGDFTVTHNTILSNMLQCNLAIRKYNTLFIQTEQTISGDIATRMYSYMLGVPMSTFAGKSAAEIDPMIMARLKELRPVWDMMRCVSTADKTAKTSRASNEVVEIIQQVMDTGFIPQFVIIDWLGKLVLDFMRASEGNNSEFYMKAEDLKATLNTFFRANNMSAIYLHQTDTATQAREPAYKPKKNDADKYRAFANDLESCICIGTATKFDSGIQVAWIGADKARMMQSGKYVMAKIDGARALIEECEEGEYALDPKGQFKPVRDLIGVASSGRGFTQRENVYVPPENSADAFMREEY